MFEARYQSTCLNCTGTIIPGTTVTMIDTEDKGRITVHLHCADDSPLDQPRDEGDHTPDVMPPGKTVQDACSRCFIIHSPGQDGCE